MTPIINSPLELSEILELLEEYFDALDIPRAGRFLCCPRCAKDGARAHGARDFLFAVSHEKPMGHNSIINSFFLCHCLFAHVHQERTK